MSRSAKAAVFFLFLLVCGTGFVLTRHMGERPPHAGARDLFAIVNQQLAAFRSDDFPSAYRQAAVAVQRKFTLPEFERMVRQSYPTMVRSQRVEFGDVEIHGASAVLQVFVIGNGADVCSFVYSLVNEEGVWKIEGVQELHRYRKNQRPIGTHV